MARLPFQCGFCKHRIGHLNAHGTGGLPRSRGGLSRVHLTGRKRLKKLKFRRGATRKRKLLRYVGELRKKYSAEHSNWVYEYVCHDCGNTGWSDHPDLANKVEEAL